MHIIFLSRHHGAARSVHLQPRLLMLAGACVVGASLLAGGFMGAWLFRAPAPVAGIEVDAALQAQSAEISSAREDAQRQMDALSVHLGELQARLVRLDALGERLTELADVDPDEFDFSLSVGQGGVDEPLEGSAYAPPSFMATLDELAARRIPASSSSRCWSNCSPTSTSASRPTWPASRCRATSPRRSGAGSIR